jgi:hypothetical protein
LLKKAALSDAAKAASIPGRLFLPLLFAHFNDEISFDRVISLLAPYIEKAEIREPSGKVWTGKAEWLDHPVKMDSFLPLSRFFY